MTARRIVSLVPSLTEAVCALGARDRLVGRTAWCVSPDGLDAVPLVGGTKDASVDAIVALAPDLVLINREENTRGVYEALLRHGIAVHVSFPTTVAEALSLLSELADLVDAGAVGIGVVGHVADVGEIHDLVDGVAREFKEPPQHVGEDKGAEVADVGKVVDGRAAVVHVHRFLPVGSGGIERLEFLDLVREGVVETDGHWGSDGWWCWVMVQ